MAAAALVLYGVWFVLAFGVRTVIQVRRTGESGFKGLGGRPGSLEWFAGVLFAIALVVGVAAPVTALAGFDALTSLDARWVAWTGAAVASIGVVATLGAQLSMGDSWRIGVDKNERTGLVTGGAFELVRNPIFSAMLLTAVVAAGAVLAWNGSPEPRLGALLIAGACLCWGLDNCVTADLDEIAPEHITVAKGVIAGGTNLLIGFALGASMPSIDVLLAALAVGAFGYGASITLWVAGARDIGAARGQLVFASAPFVGVAVAWVAFGDPIRVAEVLGLGLAAFGVSRVLGSHHLHGHQHDAIEHDHEHVHDDGHHPHRHDDGQAARHTHRHRHEPLRHAHPHVPDLHHRHAHAESTGPGR